MEQATKCSPAAAAARRGWLAGWLKWTGSSEASSGDERTGKLINEASRVGSQECDRSWGVVSRECEFARGCCQGLFMSQSQRRGSAGGGIGTVRGERRSGHPLGFLWQAKRVPPSDRPAPQSAASDRPWSLVLGPGAWGKRVGGPRRWLGPWEEQKTRTGAAAAKVGCSLVHNCGDGESSRRRVGRVLEGARGTQDPNRGPGAILHCRNRDVLHLYQPKKNPVPQALGL